jgi:hypothetical protein
MKLAIVGSFGGTHLGGSLFRAAERLGIETVRFDAGEAERGGRLAKAIRWRFADRRPAGLRRFGERVARQCQAEHVDVLVATGSAALDGRAVEMMQRLGIRCVNFASDDPWNPALKAAWQLVALPRYELVLTPRHANLADLRRLGCARVEYLPFGYDEALFGSGTAAPVAPVHDVLFVGGADTERVRFMREFMTDGPLVALVGGYWARFRTTRALALGLKTPSEISALTAAAKVNLCLVRRANRDGHVMRSLEIAAIGGAMLVEDTADHRSFFGEDADCVVYFSDASVAAARAKALIEDPAERQRLAASLRARMADARHTYRDRLQSLFEILGDER